MIRSYHGTVEHTTFDGQPCWRLVPAASGHSRHVTWQVFQPPVRVAGWVFPREWDGAHTSADPKFDGIHVHVGHVGNARNYVASLVRRDGHAKVAVEFGWRGYETLANQDVRPDLVWGRTYMLQIDWLPDRIVTTVLDEMGRYTMDAAVPPDRQIPCGSVGLRLDNVDALAYLTVERPPHA